MNNDNYCPIWHVYVFKRATTIVDFNNDYVYNWPINKMYQQLNYELQEIRNRDKEKQKQFDYWSRTLKG